ncbi:MAG TPA: hypothetical protein LFW20_01835 [Rickettsia endosymbiont of Omalisus fontisbellaquei]|nr:hypothetical protein [Rickettsia endosymbiont of Omalisus fontisbellaquei]
MSKKDFKTGFDSLLSSDKPTKTTISNERTIHASFVVNSSYVEKLKAISYWDRKKIKDVVNEAFKNYIELYEQENGPIQLPK